ncbi:DUF5615 family PIN-like protein [Candidatus Poribacteria bacterium]|nr:DUF5615 family PIN-like protein [Candidatus Poribacteria bacterium]
MKLLIDMNLSTEWVEVFERQGWQAVHWSVVGDPRASDSVIMAWARANDYVVFTHDLDFGTLLATTRVQGPSVIQVRTQDVMPQNLKSRLVQILRQYESVLESGALIIVDEARARMRILPFK